MTRSRNGDDDQLGMIACCLSEFPSAAQRVDDGLGVAGDPARRERDGIAAISAGDVAESGGQQQRA